MLAAVHSETENFMWMVTDYKIWTQTTCAAHRTPFIIT